MNRDVLTYRMAFAAVRGMGVDLANKLLEVIPSEKDFFCADRKELEAIANCKSKIFDHDYRQKLLDKATAERDFVSKNNIKVTYFRDDDYPKRFGETAPDAPILIYSLGNCNLNAKHVVSIVGTRHATVYGQKFCDKLVADLNDKIDDLVVVSGLAYGIDISAHRASLRNDVPTVAVMANGLNRIYPSSHRNDAEDIIRHGGLLVTDYMSQDVIHKGNFVARNRIIAALADATVVVESATSGGALITANLASSYNRDVFAVPGRVSDEFSSGCNKLIRNNQACMLTCADDLIAQLQWDAKVTKEKRHEAELFPELSDVEVMVVDFIKKNGDVHINVVAEALNLPVYKAMSTLMTLEYKGVINTLPGSRYAIA